MDKTISLITRALGHDVDSLNVVSQNIANMRTPGYRAERLTQDFARGLAGSGLVLDTASGPLRETGRKLDVALQDGGFFVVQSDRGTFLSRNGAFEVNREGLLVDVAGHEVMGESGPIQLDGSNVTIRADGEVMQGGRSVDRLRIVVPQQPEQLRDAGSGLYLYQGSTAGWTGTLQIGALEQSNVDPGSEMVRLMEVTRHAQALQHAMHAYDEVLQDGISRLGKKG